MSDVLGGVLATASREKTEATESRSQLSLTVEVCLVLAVSAALLVPCLWTDHIQAMDLSSHVYNAWLAGQIERGAVPSLTLTHPWTNILTDVALQSLVGRIGPVGAERIVTGACVLVFFWGAFYLTSVVSQRRAWILAPTLAMLAYGLIFHHGFLNFYLATGLSMWIIGLLWDLSRRRALLAVVLAILAFLTHAMPLAWAGGVLVYVYLARRIAVRMRPIAILPALLVVGALQALVLRVFPARWSLAESINLLGMTGTDQVRLFDAKYLIIVAGLIAILGVMLLERVDVGGLLADPVVHICIIQAVAYILVPSAIQLPHYKHVLAFIPERISLFNAVMLCAMVGRARYGRGITRITALVATLFFTFLYLDVRAHSVIDGRITELARQVPPGARFVAEVADSNSNLNPLLHAADWACIGHCYSYANYEPATGQFRIQVDGANAVVAADMSTVQAIEAGEHIITPKEAPIYSVCRCEKESPPLCLRHQEAGERTCSFSIPITWGLPQSLSGRLAR